MHASLLSLVDRVWGVYYEAELASLWSVPCHTDCSALQFDGTDSILQERGREEERKREGKIITTRGTRHPTGEQAGRNRMYKTKYNFYKPTQMTRAKFNSSCMQPSPAQPSPTEAGELAGLRTHPERLSLGQIHLPFVLRVVVDQEARVQHEVAVFERLVQRALLHEGAPLAGLRQLECKRPLLSTFLRHLAAAVSRQAVKSQKWQGRGKWIY